MSTSVRDGMLGTLAAVMCLATTFASAGTDVLVGSAAKSAVPSNMAVRERRGNVVVVDTTSSYDMRLPGGMLNDSARQSVAAAAIQTLGDRYDFIVVAPEFQVNLGEFQGLHWQVSNQVNGIGRPQLDLSSHYGSAGRLKAVIDIDEALLQTSFTENSYDALLDTLMHEVMHQWVAYFDLRVIAGDDQTLLTSPSSHWSSRYDSQASVMFGARWQLQSDGRFRATQIRDGYGPLDLYLAGLLPAAELAPTSYLRTSVLSGTELPELGRTVPATVETLLPARIIDVLGPRVPAAGQSQKRFTAALVLLARAGDPVLAGSLDRLELLRLQAQARFAAITLGRAQLKIGTLPESLAAERGSPVGVGSTLGSASALDLPLATSWIASKQLSSGLWQDKSATTLHDSRRALAVLATEPTAYASALNTAWQRLNSESGRTVDRLAGLLRLPGLSASRRSELLQSLLGLQRNDGGWGMSGEFSASSLDTALALGALADVNSRFPGAVPPSAIAAAQDLLATRFRGAVKCWSVGITGPCDLLTSVNAVDALAGVGEYGDAALFAEGLFRWQRSSGFGSGNDPTALETARVLSALQRAALGGDSRVAPAEAYLAAQQRSDGSWAGSVSATAEAVLWFLGRQRADLRISGGIAVDPAAPVQGQRLDIGFDAENSGTQPAPATELAIEFRTASGAVWTALATPTNLPVLAPGQRSRITAQLPTAALAAGDYQLRVRLDTAQAVPERDETNNVGDRTFTLLAAPSLPDLTIVDHSLQIVPAVITSVPQQVEVRLDIENLGTAAVSQAVVRINGWRFGELRPLASVQRDLTGQSRATITQSIEVTDLDISRIVVVLDPDNAVVEASESNNQAQVFIDRQPTVDLALSASDVVLPATVEEGTPTSFQITVRNLGTSQSPITRLRTEVVHADGSVVLLSDQQLQLEPAAMAQRRIDWTPDRAGSSRLRAVVDPEATVVEIREDNNNVDLPFEVAASTRPNLTIVPDNWAVTPDPALQGAPVTIGVSVTNNSAHPSTPADVEFLIADLGASNYVSVGSVRLTDGLAAGAIRPVSVQIPNLVAANARQLLVRVDARNEVVEGNESDNESLRSLTVKALPNLQITAVDTHLAPNNPAPGATGTITAVVRNTGEQAIASVAVDLLLGSGSTATNLAPPQTVTNLAPGAATNLSFTFTRPVAAGVTRIQLIGDRAQGLHEGREDDNAVTIDLDEVDPDFFLSETYISPNGDGIQDRTDIVVRFDPPRPALMRIVAPWGEEVASFGDAATPVATLTGTWDGRRPDGRRALDDRYEVRVEDPNGVLIKLRTVVVDTNRSPLVHAARDGHALLTPLTCATAGNSLNPLYGDSITSPGLNFTLTETELAGQGQSSRGLYRVDFDGSPPRPLLLRTAVPNALPYGAWSYWLEPDGGVAGMIIGTQNGAYLYRISTNAAGLLEPPVLLNADGGAHFLGVFDSGHRVFASSSGQLFALIPNTGQIVNLSEPGVVDFDIADPVVGGSKVLVPRRVGNEPQMRLRLYGLDGVSAVVAEVNHAQTRFKPQLQYSAVRRSFFVASGAIWSVQPEPIGRQQIIEIPEATGVATVLVERPGGLANLTLSLSPSGSQLVTVIGVDAHAQLWDLNTGVRTEIDLTTTKPDVTSALPDYSVGMAIFDFFWSPDETRLAAQFHAYQDTDGGGDWITGLLIDTRIGDIRPLGSFIPEGWIAGELQLVGGTRGIAIERGFDPVQLLPGSTLAIVRNHWPSYTDGRTSVMELANTAGQYSCSFNGSQALSSTANGIADLALEYVEALHGFAVSGTARDLNLRSYSIEFQRDGGPGWVELLTGTESVDDNFLGVWSPPGPGRYVVRMRVADVAGNEVYTERSVVWFESTPFGMASADERIISPNGDGVKDQVAIRYELRTPSTIQLRVNGPSGNLVRSQSLVHPVPGTFIWQWDGRNQAGELIADGNYQILIHDRLLSVAVDTTLPTIRDERGPPMSQGCQNLVASEDWARMTLHDGYLTLRGTDQNWLSLSLEQRPRGSGQPWSLLAATYDAIGAGEMLPLSVRLKPAELIDLEFRGLAKDRAGNSSMIGITFSGVGIASGRFLYPPGSIHQGHRYDQWVYAGNSIKHDLPELPRDLRFGLLSIDPAEWRLQIQTFMREFPGEIGPQWIDVPWQSWSESSDSNSGGDLRFACYGDREWLVAAQLPRIPGAKSAWVRMVRTRDGIFEKSNLFAIQTVPPPSVVDESPGGSPPEVEYCSRIGGDQALLPLDARLGVSASWTDPRIGEAISLPVTIMPSMPLRVGITALPPGEHRILVRYEDLNTWGRTTAGKDNAAPQIRLDRPLEGARFCVGSGVNEPTIVGNVAESFLTSVSYSVWSQSQPEFTIGSDLEVPRLRLPESDELALSTYSPLPITTNPLGTLRSGPGFVRVTARDCFAEVSVQRAVVIDGEVNVDEAARARAEQSGTPPSVMLSANDPREVGFAPELDQFMWFSVFARERVNATAAIWHIRSRPTLTPEGLVGEWSTVGTMVAALGERVAVPGRQTWVWDGRGINGQFASDGDYVAKITITDDCGHRTIRYAPFYVDKTPPEIVWVSPAVDSVAAVFQPLRADLADAHPSTASLQYRALVGGGDWVGIGDMFVYGGFPPAQLDPLALWHSTVPAGGYLLRLNAKDEVGHVASSEIPVRVIERQPLLESAHASPDLISPNGDGIVDSSNLRLRFNRVGILNLGVTSVLGNVVRSMVVDSQTAGEYSRIWDGRNEANAVVTDGDYRFKIRVVDPAQPANIEELELPVAVDNTAPAVAFVAPAGAYSNGHGPLTIELTELHPQALVVSSSPAMPGLQTQFDNAGTLGLADLDAVPEGDYRIDLVADDRAGNRGTFSHSFTLDRTAPVVAINAPETGAVVTRMNGPIAVVGSASDSHPSTWVLRVVHVASDTARIIATSDPAVSGPVQANWDGVGADGDYRIELEATDRAGNHSLGSVTVALDNTPPTARIDTPVASAMVGLSWPLSGTADDVHFSGYVVDIAAAGPTPAWNRVAADDGAVVDGTLASVVSPDPDGQYIVRLRVTDAAGLVSEAFRDVQVDTVPPSAPLSLTAQRAGAHDVRLTWTASVSPDVHHYRIYRDAATLLDTAGLTTTHLDSALVDGRYRYRVAAVDRAGNLSPPSPEATVSIDTTPPDVRITQPFAAARLRGVVVVQGRAYSREDFERFELRATRIDQPSATQVIAFGGSAVLAGELGRLDSRAWPEAFVRLELEAWDTSGNHAVHQVEFVVDNLPPAPPQGLVALAEAENVRLNWNPNGETDLKGYLVYRGPRLLQGDPALDPRTLSIPDPTWLDELVGDGSHQWRAVAVDTTGNVSDFSAPASLVRSGHPPRVNLVRPLDGERFETRTLVRGQSADLDLAEVRFESRALPAGTWMPVAAPMSVPPWEADFVPVARAFGDYRLRARSLDTEGLEDPTPPEITVTHRDLTAPARPLTLTAAVDGDVVTLVWAAVAVDDLAGYRLERATPAGEFTVVADVGSSITTRIDSNVADGSYRYRVRARDDSDNYSQASPIALARVYAPTVDQPYTPSPQPFAEFVLQSPVAGTVQGVRTSTSGTLVLAEFPVDANQAVTRPVELDLGDNSIAFKVRDALGNLSRAAPLALQRVSVPPTPHTLVSTLQGFSLTLGWQVAVHPDPFGFRVFRDGEPVLADQPLKPSTLLVVMDGAPVSAPELIDGSLSTTRTLPLGAGGIELQATLPGNPIIVATELEFSGDAPELTVALDADWHGHWVRLPVSIEASGGRILLTAAQPYRSGQMRLTLNGAADLVSLAEIRAVVRPVQSLASLTETLPDGRHRYRVSTVNQHAFESPASEPLDVEVGDVTPPDAVVLSGSVTGSDAALSWTASIAPDLAAYWVMRGNTQVAVITQLNNRQYVDASLANGQYGYRVFAVDGVGNITPSNLLVLGVDVGSLSAPVGLTVTPVVGGGALDLSWQRGPGGIEPAGYRIKRALVAAGPFEQLDEQAPTSYTDTGLTNGTRYHYRIQAFDAVGNLSPDSEPASGVPFTDQPVAAPEFVYPTRYGRSVTVPQRLTVVAGKGQAGSSVLIGTGTGAPQTSVVSSEASVRQIESGTERMEVAPDGNHVYLWGGSDQLVRAATVAVSLTPLTEPCAIGQWLSAQRLLVCERQGSEAQLSILRLPALDREPLLTLPEVRAMRVAADAQRLVVVAYLSSGAADPVLAWRSLAANGNWQIIADVDPDEIDPATLRFDPSGRWVLWRNANAGNLRVADLNTGTVSTIDLDIVDGLAVGFAKRAPLAVIPAGGPGGYAVYTVDLTTSTASWNDFGFGPFLGADFDSDDSHLALLVENSGWRYYSWPGRELLESVPISSPYRLQRLGTDEWAVSTNYGYGELWMVQPAGLFRLEALPLQYGNNLVAAIASAPGQLDSSPALPITVVVPADGLPDLAVRSTDLTTLPNIGLPGNTARIAARIRNLGSVHSTAAPVRMLLTAPNGTALAPLESTLTALPPGGEQAVAWTTPVLTLPGIYSITVQIDPARTQPESSVANNIASRLFTVNGDGRPELSLTTDSALIAPTGNLTGHADVVNGAAAFNGTLQVRVVDDAGHLVSVLRNEAVTLTSPGELRPFALQWAPAGVRAGHYRVVAELRDLAGVLVRERNTPVEVQAVALLQVQLTPVQQVVAIGAAIPLQARVRYVTGNYTIDGGELRTRLLAANGATLATDTRPLPAMTDGFQSDFNLSFASAALPAGAYSVVSEVWSTQLLAESGATLSLMAGATAPAVSGSFQLGTTPLIAGQAQTIVFEVRNSGAQPLVDIPIRASARRQLQSDPLAVVNHSWTLAPGESRQGSLSLAGSNMLPGGLVLILNVPSGPLSAVLDYRAPVVVDGEPPQIVRIRPILNAIVPRAIEVEARVVDVHSSLAQVESRLGSGGWNAMAAGASYAGQYASRELAAADGPATVQVRARDSFGNLAVSDPWPVVVDSLPPVIVVSGVANNGAYATPVTPVIGVTDAHLDQVQTTLNGASFNSGTLVSGDARYTLFVAATDLAGNRATAVVSLEIDTRPPTLSFTFPAEGAVIAAATSDVRLATEAGATVVLGLGTQQWTATADANGVAAFAAVPLVEGTNLLRANAVDRVGNAAPEQTRTLLRSTVTVGIVGGSVSPAALAREPGDPIDGSTALNNTGAAALTQIPARLSLVSVISGQTIAQQQWLSDIGAGQNSARPFAFATTGMSLGAYMLQLEAELRGSDGALRWVGLDQKPVAVADLSPPELTLTSPNANQLLGSSFNVLAAASDRIDQVEVVELKLDAGAFVAMTPAAAGSYVTSLSAIADGAHMLQVRASDRAGNAVTTPTPARPIEVDGTPPQIVISGIEEGQLSAQPLTATISISDVHPGSNVIQLDGVAYVSGTAINVEGAHVLRVEATDAAGNTAQAQRSFTLDFTAPLTQIIEPAGTTAVGDAHIRLLAQTESGIDVELLDQPQPVTLVSDATGRALFAAVPLLPGENILRVRSRDRAGNVGAPVSVNVIRFAVAQAPVTALVTLPASVAHGQALQGLLQLTASVAANGQPDHIRIEILRADQSLVTTVNQDVALQLNQTLDLPLNFATTTWPAGMLSLRVSWRRGPDGASPWSVLRTVPVEIRDEVGPDITLLEPEVGASVPDPILVRVRVTDALSAIGPVAAHLDNGAWYPLTRGSQPDEWQTLLPAPGLGSRMLSIRAEDSYTNPSLFGPVPLCRSDIPNWSGFANGFENGVRSKAPLGFEIVECGALSGTAKSWFEWWLGMDKSGADAARESADAQH